MRFDFFTLGGSQLWEDIFFYQKWRIQRYFESKKCRLLDPWDIKRCEGSFEKCSKAFYKFIEVYEMPRQKGHMIIMLHGLYDSKNIFKPLWRLALKHNFMAAAVNYPSSQKNLEAHVAQMNSFLNNLIDINEVSFVTKGVGALIVRELLARPNQKWQSKIKVNKIVEVAPPNKGSKLFAYLAQYKTFNLIFGPMLKNATPQKVIYVPEIEEKYPLGIVDCETGFAKFFKLFGEKSFSEFYSRNEAVLEKHAQVIAIDNWHWNPFKNEKINQQIVYFLEHGEFEKK